MNRSPIHKHSLQVCVCVWEGSGLWGEYKKYKWGWGLCVCVLGGGGSSIKNINKKIFQNVICWNVLPAAKHKYEQCCVEICL